MTCIDCNGYSCYETGVHFDPSIGPSPAPVECPRCGLLCHDVRQGPPCPDCSCGYPCPGPRNGYPCLPCPFCGSSCRGALSPRNS